MFEPSDLIILTISRSASIPEWWLDQADACDAAYRWVAAPRAKYIEAVLDEIVASIGTLGDDPYILRLDDDEWVTPEFAGWLAERAFTTHDHWKFPRLHRWTPTTAIVNASLWPDPQTRLSRKSKSGGRGVIHAGSPFGGGELSDCVFIHDKFLKSLPERQKIAATYDAVMEGAGTGAFAMFNVPETCAEEIRTVPFAYLDTPWRPDR